MPSSDLRQEDRGLGRLPLAVEDTVFPDRVRPVLQQLARGRRDTLVLAVPPALDLAAQVVDQLVAFPALGGQLDVEGLLHRAVALLRPFAASSDRDE